MQVTLFGTPDSVYTRIVRLVLGAKSIRHEMVMADVFEDRGLPSDYASTHPFRRIPAIEIDGRVLYETDAIVHHLNRLVSQPALVPTDAWAEARMRQIMRVVDNYAYGALVWGIYVPFWWREERAPDDTAFGLARRALAALGDLAGEGLADTRPTLAWFYLGVVLAMADSVEPGTGLIDEVPALRLWWNGFRKSPLMVHTRTDQSLY